MTKKFVFIVFFVLTFCSFLSADQIDLNRRIAEQMFVNSVTSNVPRIQIVQETTPFEVKINTNAFGNTIRFGNKTYEHGISMNSPNHLHIVLKKPASRFIADIGIDRNTDGHGGTVRYNVLIDKKFVFSSEIISKENSPKQIEVPLNGVTEFELTVDDGGDGRSYDQGSWADAKIIYQDGTETWLDSLPLCGLNRLPFKFCLDGKPSDEFLNRCEKNIKIEELVNEQKIVYTLTFFDSETKLELKAVVMVYTDTPGIDWTLYFTNHGATDSLVLSNLDSLYATLQNQDYNNPYILHRLKGCGYFNWLEDWSPFEEIFSHGKRIDFAPEHGRPSLRTCPFFTVQSDNGGVVTAIGWSGRWKASVYCEDTTYITAGLQKLNLALKPNESIRSPRILQSYWNGGDVTTGNNGFRQTMIRHILPKIDDKPICPPITYNFGPLDNDKGTESDVLNVIEKSKELGFEYYWHDAFYAPKPFPNVGDYGFPLKRSFHPQRFPNGLTVISQKTHEAGQKYLQWFEPERASNGSIMATEHPEWLVTSPQNPMGGLVNLGIPEAWQFVHDFFAACIKEYQIDCVRIDFNHLNTDILWSVLDEQNGHNRIGLGEIRYVEGLYALWDSLIQEFPGLFFDNCASGGQRIDLEMCSRSLPLWRTDATITPISHGDAHTASMYNQIMTYGLNRYVPFSTSGNIGTAPYFFRSGFNAGTIIIFYENILRDDFPREELKNAIAEGKRIRKYFYGNYYPITPLNTGRSSLCIMQYHRPEESDGMIIAFRREQSIYASASHLPLREIDPNAEYEIVVSKSYSPEKPRKISGQELLKMKIELDSCPDSVIVEYKKL